MRKEITVSIFALACLAFLPAASMAQEQGNFGRAATEAAIHRGRCSGVVRVVAVLTRKQWDGMHGDYKRKAADGARCVLHLDPSDGTTCLVPAIVVEGR